MTALIALQRQIRDCMLCTAHLPLGPRPVFQLHPDARILIAGQAPGRTVHETGVPFADASGDRLRDWLGMSQADFYDTQKVAILPMGFCYPGTGRNGDLPPRPECAAAWRSKLLAHLRKLQLTLVIGQYAMAYHLPQRNLSLTETVQRWREYGPAIVPLPHPSPRNNIWLKRNPWFLQELIPNLQKRVAEALSTVGA
ncbi:MAG: uracil-DNA glycosylase family protein [Betaproteobacteria bacterium]|nr:uracil-DNA glycosylase family protein [Betaproteobacteria bacterium]